MMSNIRKPFERFNPHHHTLWAAACILALLASPMAHAFNFDVGDTGIKGQLNTELTIGAMVRTESRNPKLIGKTNIRGQQNLCDGFYGAFSCSTKAGNAKYIGAKGSAAAINGDNGDLNYSQWNFISAAAKITPELKLHYRQFKLDLSGLYFFDVINHNFDETHPNNFGNHGFQHGKTPRPSGAEDDLSNQFVLLKAYVSGAVPFVGQRRLHFKIGNQVLNQGRSKFLIFNSLNSINPPDANLAHLPGSEIAEVLRPVPMVVLSTDITDKISTKAFYQFVWRHAGIPPVGSYFSSVDLLGNGGRYGMLSFGRAREDPNRIAGTAGPGDKSQVPGAAGTISKASRTFLRAPTNEPSDQGEWGISLSYFARELNYTMFSVYYRNLHSHFPFLSFISADQSCAANSSGVGELLTDCPGLASRKARPLPVDSIQYFADYPENIHTFGFSFSTSLGPASWAGELAYRPNQPLQVNPTDLVYAALQPAFPNRPIVVPGVGVIPSRRVAVPDNVEYKYRGHNVGPHEIIRGYVRRDTLNAETSFLFLTGSQNPFGASSINTVVEIGAYSVLNMPDRNKVQLAGPGTQFHHSAGKDGTGALNSQQKALISKLEAGGKTHKQAVLLTTGAIQNPHYQAGHFADSFSWGYRILSRLDYENVFAGVDLLPEFGFFHDVTGTSPGPGRNYIEGRMRFILGLRFNYHDTWYGGVRHVWFRGGGRYNAMNDRDYLEFDLRYSF